MDRASLLTPHQIQQIQSARDLLQALRSRPVDVKRQVLRDSGYAEAVVQAVLSEKEGD